MPTISIRPGSTRGEMQLVACPNTVGSGRPIAPVKWAKNRFNISAKNVVLDRRITQMSVARLSRCHGIAKTRKIIPDDLDVVVSRCRCLERDSVGIAQRSNDVTLNQNVAWP